MKPILSSAEPIKLEKAIADHVLADYVYMYPPRQTYRNFEDKDIEPLIVLSLDKFHGINLYFHFPFCQQICAFCNLYALVAKDHETFEKYISVNIRLY